MIKSSNLSIKFANRGKKKSLALLVFEYRKALQFYVDLMWDLSSVSKFNDLKIYGKFEHEWMSSRLKQCAAKQAALIIKGVKKKYNARKAVVAKFIKSGDIGKAEKLQKVIEKNPISKPDCTKINPELDYRFVELQRSEDSNFDYISFNRIILIYHSTYPFIHFGHLLEQLDINSM